MIKAHIGGPRNRFGKKRGSKGGRAGELGQQRLAQPALQKTGTEKGKKKKCVQVPPFGDDGVTRWSLAGVQQAERGVKVGPAPVAGPEFQKKDTKTVKSSGEEWIAGEPLHAKATPENPHSRGSGLKRKTGAVKDGEGGRERKYEKKPSQACLLQKHHGKRPLARCPQHKVNGSQKNGCPKGPRLEN